jgi:hypothetical protein
MLFSFVLFPFMLFSFRFGDPDKSVTQRLFYPDFFLRDRYCVCSHCMGSFGGVVIFGGECTIALVDYFPATCDRQWRVCHCILIGPPVLPPFIESSEREKLWTLTPSRENVCLTTTRLTCRPEEWAYLEQYVHPNNNTAPEATCHTGHVIVQATLGCSVFHQAGIVCTKYGLRLRLFFGVRLSRKSQFEQKPNQPTTTDRNDSRTTSLK